MRHFTRQNHQIRWLGERITIRVLPLHLAALLKIASKAIAKTSFIHPLLVDRTLGLRVSGLIDSTFSIYDDQLPQPYTSVSCKRYHYRHDGGRQETQCRTG